MVAGRHVCMYALVNGTLHPLLAVFNLFFTISCGNDFFLLSLHPLRNGQVFYDQLPLNPPGRERSKGIRL